MSTKTAFFAVAIASAALLYTVQARANTAICTTYPKLIKVLSNRFNEVRQSSGTDGASNQIEIYANPKTGSWTLIATSPAGKSCIIASGSGFKVPKNA